MDTEIEKVYETYFELFGSEGWKQLTSDLRESRDEFDNLLSVKDSKELHQRQGQITMINTILNMPDMMEQAYKQALYEEDEYDA